MQTMTVVSASIGTEDNKNEGNEFENWKSSMFAMLSSACGSVSHARSISIVPDHLRKSSKDAYTPKVISIGPIHRRSKRDLVYTEEIKGLYMLSLLHRTEDPNEMLNECSEAMYRMDEVARASYVGDLNSIDRYELAKIMLLDGCFLLELLLGNNVEFSAALPCNLALSSPGPLCTRKKEEICSDLMVLENQIPQFVLYSLSTILFPGHFTERDGKKLINHLVLSFFGYTPGPSSINTAYDAAHILELLHSFVTRKLGLGEPLEETACVPYSSSPGKLGIYAEKSASRTVESHHEKIQLKRCAAKLEASGVTIKSLGSAPAEGAGFYFGIKFRRGELKIPQLHITTTTQVKWMNFVAWEQNITSCEEVRWGSSMISCKFSCYALFLRGLICCEHDIELLRERNVIVVHDDGNSTTIRDKKKSKKMSNRDLLFLFNNIAGEVCDINFDVIVNSGFGKLFEELNSHKSTANLFIGMFKAFWHYFRCLLTSLGHKCEKSYEILKIEYTPTVWKQMGIAYAGVLLGLTIARVALQAISV